MSQDNSRTQDPPVTPIDVFEVPAEHIDALVVGRRRHAEIMRTKPGFLSTQLRRVLSSGARFRLANVARWESREVFRAATADAGFRERTGAAIADPRVPISANPGPYEVVVGHGVA